MHYRLGRTIIWLTALLSLQVSLILPACLSLIFTAIRTAQQSVGMQLYRLQGMSSS